MIKILLDQNIPALIEPWLQDIVGDAANITSTRTLGFQQRDDDEIFYYCQKNKMVIITYDEDFQNPLLIKETPGCGAPDLREKFFGCSCSTPKLLEARFCCSASSVSDGACVSVNKKFELLLGKQKRIILGKESPK